MQFSLATVILGLAALASAAVTDSEGIRNAQRDTVIVDRQAGNGGRPTPDGTCCAAEKNLKQDSCVVNGAQGRCVPGGQPCGGSLSCVAQANLACDASIQERGKDLCRAKAANGGFIDGAKIISSLSQAKVN